ncbi:putative non-specific lipid-transfer protein AKCS9-like [Capsicum annuum]|nr:putative non-specific lipid-transfer protein AKCS9-like [Capsicum annuum]
MLLILSSTYVLSAMIAAGCFIAALLIVLCLAKNWTLRGLCIGWYIQGSPFTTGVMNSLFSVYDIYDDLISRRVNTSDAEKFAELCPCCCAGPFWGVLWSFRMGLMALQYCKAEFCHLISLLILQMAVV